MAQKVIPMIHVPDVRATMTWYASTLGFKVVNHNEEDGQINWAMLQFGESQIMLNEGGKPSSEWRREVDLYLYVDDVDELHRHIRDHVDLVEPPHDTFYGMRELIIRDINRFWITFGQPSAK